MLGEEVPEAFRAQFEIIRGDALWELAIKQMPRLHMKSHSKHLLLDHLHMILQNEVRRDQSSQ